VGRIGRPRVPTHPAIHEVRSLPAVLNQPRTPTRELRARSRARPSIDLTAEIWGPPQSTSLPLRYEVAPSVGRDSRRDLQPSTNSVSLSAVLTEGHSQSLFIRSTQQGRAFSELTVNQVDMWRETCASTPERRDLKSRGRRSTQSDLTVLEQSHEHRQIDRQSSSNPVALEIRCLTIVLSTQCRERSFSHRCRALTRRVAAVSLVDRHPQCDGLVHGGHWSNPLAISLIRALRSSGDFRWLSPQHLRPEGQRPCVPTSDVREGVCASLGRFPDRSPNL
jgi:hypothetical protein